MDERDELRSWLQRGLAYSVTLPAKQKKPRSKKAVHEKPVAKKRAAKQPKKSPARRSSR